MTKLKVAVLFGGVSTEHEISIVSAKSIMQNMDKEKIRSNSNRYNKRRKMALVHRQN